MPWKRLMLFFELIGWSALLLHPSPNEQYQIGIPPGCISDNRLCAGNPFDGFNRITLAWDVSAADELSAAVQHFENISVGFGWDFDEGYPRSIRRPHCSSALAYGAKCRGH